MSCVLLLHLQAPALFISALVEILGGLNNDIVSWTASGKGFIIKDSDRFANEILQRHFKHNRLSSFQRQLNLYGFRKVRYTRP
ncbi:heat shock transcription factor [Tribonema minus]|uniref:Heat shock transcription factor n=1 Tax=Tribonema minus TaxID=303371 RepID=A0A835YVU6_9STRA|nr:heat shock transcription factor [Tribonema minus]